MKGKPEEGCWCRDVCDHSSDLHKGKEHATINSEVQKAVNHP